MSDIKHKIFVGAKEVVGIDASRLGVNNSAPFTAASRNIFASSRIRTADEQNI